MNLGKKILFWISVLGLGFSIGCDKEVPKPEKPATVIVRQNISDSIQERRRIYGAKPASRLECKLKNYDEEGNIIGERDTVYISFPEVMRCSEEDLRNAIDDEFYAKISIGEDTYNVQTDVLFGFWNDLKTKYSPAEPSAREFKDEYKQILENEIICTNMGLAPVPIKYINTIKESDIANTLDTDADNNQKGEYMKLEVKNKKYVMNLRNMIGGKWHQLANDFQEKLEAVYTTKIKDASGKETEYELTKEGQALTKEDRIYKIYEFLAETTNIGVSSIKYVDNVILKRLDKKDFLQGMLDKLEKEKYIKKK